MIKVVVLDSGLDVNSQLAQTMNFTGGLEVYVDADEAVQVGFTAVDDVGHGTAVSSLIYKLCNDVEIIPIKIIHKGITASTDTMLAALRYIYDNIECNIINISAGIVSCDKKKELYQCCKLLADKGVIIISAYDNSDAISYPAAFDCVIGIGGDRKNWGAGKYKRVLNNRADYVGINKERHLSWLNNTYEVVSGNSFIAPEFVHIVADLMEKGHKDFADIVHELDQGAFATLNDNIYQESKPEYTITKAIVFPFNKEMHSLARYEELLDFEIVGFCDTKYSRNIGKPVTEAENSKVIINIDDVNWNDDFDTVILGHTSIMSEAINIDLESYIVGKCIKHNKNLFSCKDIRDRKDICESKINLYCPHIDKITQSEFLKMHVIGCPVLGVTGTGSSQGKFTMQLGIRKELMARGFRIGQLGTEPTAQLFGMDAVFPMGHESAVYVKGFDAIEAINKILGNIEKKEPDIIIFGNQSNTVPFHVGGPRDYPVVQHELLLGCQADAYILCVSNDAPLEYIKRTISYLEGLYRSDVIAIAISPISMGARWSTISVKKQFIDADELNKFSEELKKVFHMPVFAMSDNDFYTKIADTIVNYFQ